MDRLVALLLALALALPLGGCGASARAAAPRDSSIRGRNEVAATGSPDRDADGIPDKVDALSDDQPAPAASSGNAFGAPGAPPPKTPPADAKAEAKPEGGKDARGPSNEPGQPAQQPHDTAMLI